MDMARQRARQAEAPPLERRASELCPDIGTDRTILWTDDRRNVGLRFLVKCTESRLYEGEDDLDDVPLSFEIEIQGRHLLVQGGTCC